MLDLDALGKEEKENWVWHGAQPLKPEYKLALVSLSRGGADASVVREFDLTTKSFVKDGYTLPEAKSQVAWRGPDSVFVGTDFGPGSLTKSGYPRIVKEWKRGTPLAEAAVVFEGQPDDMSVSAYRDLTPGFERDIVVRRPTFWTSEIFLRRDGKLVKIEKPDDARASFAPRVAAASAAIRLDSRRQDLPGRCAASRPISRRFSKGSRDFDVLFEPTERKSLAGFSPTRHHILVNELDNVRSRIYVLTHRDGRWHREPLPGVPEFGEVSVNDVDPDESDDYFLNVTDFLTPTTLALGTVGGGPATTLKQLPAFFDASGLAVSQHEAVSKDGTRVPYFEVARKDLDPRRQEPDLALRLRRIRDLDAAVVPAGRRGGLAGEGGSLRRRQHPRRRRVRPEVAPGGAQGQPAQGLRGLHRRRRGPDPPQGDLAARTWASRGAATAAC